MPDVEAGVFHLFKNSDVPLHFGIFLITYICIY